VAIIAPASGGNRYIPFALIGDRLGEGFFDAGRDAAVAAGPVSARVEKPPKEEAAGAGWSAYGESVRLRLFMLAIGGSVSRRRLAQKACNETIAIEVTGLS
jgi:hypothetical protein